MGSKLKSLELFLPALTVNVLYSFSKCETVLEVDCEMFGEYQTLINKGFENPLIWKTLSDDEKETFDEGRRVLSDFYWFGWESKQKV